MHHDDNRPVWVTNVCFHGVGRPERDLEPGEADYWISSTVFMRVLDAVVGRDDVRISFDDGNLSDVAIALPALVERDLRAEFFVLAGRLDQPGSLTSDDVRLLRDRQMGIGSHGMHHVAWRGASPESLRDEIVTARDVLTDVVGRPIDSAACPFGEYDRRALAALRRAGYRRVMTSDRAVTRDRAWLQPRFSVRASDTVESVSSLLRHRSTLFERTTSRARSLAKSLR